MDTMFKYGSEGEYFYENSIFFLFSKVNECSTSHEFLREQNIIISYVALAFIEIQSNQNN